MLDLEKHGVTVSVTWIHDVSNVLKGLQGSACAHHGKPTYELGRHDRFVKGSKDVPSLVLDSPAAQGCERFDIPKARERNICILGSTKARRICSCHGSAICRHGAQEASQP